MKRKRYSPDFKAKIALEAIKELQTTAEPGAGKLHAGSWELGGGRGTGLYLTLVSH